MQHRYQNAHDNPLYALCEVRDGKVFATGDDEGVSLFLLSFVFTFFIF